MIMDDLDAKSKEALPRNGEGQQLSGVTLLELRIFHCRYIVNEGIFCGAEVHRVSYCKTHYRLCYIKARAPASSQP
jgi:hypothetical protein